MTDEDPVLWECLGCSLKVYRDLDGDEPYGLKDGSLWRGDPEPVPEHYVGIEPDVEPEEPPTEGLCADCITSCDHCEKPAAKSHTGDTYGEVAGLPVAFDTCRKEACSEDCMSEIETADADQAWESWARRDFEKGLRTGLGELWENAEPVRDTREAFETWREAANVYWEAESDGMTIDVGRVLEAMPLWAMVSAFGAIDLTDLDPNDWGSDEEFANEVRRVRRLDLIALAARTMAVKCHVDVGRVFVDGGDLEAPIDRGQWSNKEMLSWTLKAERWMGVEGKITYTAKASIDSAWRLDIKEERDGQSTG